MSFFPSEVGKKKKKQKPRVVVVAPLVGDRTSAVYSTATEHVDFVFLDVFGRQSSTVKQMLDRPFDVLSYVDAVKKTVLELNASIVFTHELSALIAAAVGEELRKDKAAAENLDCLPPPFNSVARAVNKAFTPLRGHRLSDHAGVLTEKSGAPKSKQLVRSWTVACCPVEGGDEQVKARAALLEDVTYPAVVKPAALSGGLLVYQVDNREQLEQALENLDAWYPSLAAMHLTLMQKYCTDPELRAGLPDADAVDGQTNQTRVLPAAPIIVEAYVANATLHTVEGWTDGEGDHHMFGIQDTEFFTAGNTRILDRQLMPSQLPQHGREALKQSAFRAVDSLDWTDTFWNVELWRMPNGDLVLLEINVGTTAQDALYKGVFSTDLLDFVCNVSMGQEVSAPTPYEVFGRGGAAAQRCGAQVFVHTFADCSSTSAVLNFEEAWTMPTLDLFLGPDDPVDQSTGGRGRLLCSFTLFADRTRDLTTAADRLRAKLLLQPDQSAPAFKPAGPNPHVLQVLVLAPLARDVQHVARIQSQSTRYNFHVLELPGGIPSTGEFELDDPLPYVDAAVEYYKQHKIDLLLYSHDFASIVASALQSQLQLETGVPTLESVFRASHKYYSRKYQAGHQLKQQAYSLDHNTLDESIQLIKQTIGFPAYVKPPCLMMTTGQFLVRTEEDFRQAMRSVRDMIVKKSLPINSVFRRFIDGTEYPLVRDPSCMCAEELVSNAQQHCVEGWSDAQGVPHVWAIFDQNYYEKNGKGSVDNYSCPTRLSKKKEREIIEVAFQTARGHSWRSGFWNVELWIKEGSGEIIVTEINSRAASVWSGIYEKAYGCDHYQTMLRVANGETIPPDDTPYALRASVAGGQFHLITYSNRPAGELMDYEKAWQVPGIEIFHQETEHVQQTRSSGSWLARFELYGSSYAEIKQKADQIRKDILLASDESPEP